MLQIADHLHIKPEVFAKEGKRTVAIGMTGSGKTNTLMVQSEEWMLQGWPMTGIDPNGQLWRLKEQGFPVIVAANRPDADIPLTVDNAPILAEFSFKQRQSIILDTRLHEPGVDMEVIAAYLERLWRLILTQDDKKAQPYGLVIDEAQLFIPQMGMRPTTSIINDAGKRGRWFKLTMMMATQRPAAIQKDFLDQADLIYWQKLRGKTLEYAADALSMSVKEVRSIMKPFGPGAAVIGDAFAFIGDVDYLIVQVRPRRGMDETEVSQPVVAPGLRVLDASVLESLRSMMKTETKPKLKPEAATQLDMTIALESALAAQKVEAQQMRSRYAAMVMALYMERSGLQKQLAMADERVKTLQAKPVVTAVPVQKAIKIPELAMTASNEVMTGSETVEHSIVTTTTVETFRSSRSIAMAVNRQKGAFATFMARIQALRPIHRRILTLAVDDERGTLVMDKLTVKLDYSYDALRHAMADLLKMGLLLKLDTRTYQSNIHSLFRQRFEDLPQDDLINQLWSVIEE